MSNLICFFTNKDLVQRSKANGGTCEKNVAIKKPQLRVEIANLV